MSKPLRVGVIGCGVIAATHIEAYQRLENVRVDWVCDLKRDRAEQRAEKYGVANVATDYREMLADAELDLVSICTDHASHAELVAACFDAGKHVLCEKALGASIEQLDAMIAAHARHPELVFAGVFQHRHDPINRRLKKLVDDGTFGTLLTASMVLHCYRSNAYYQDDWHGTWDKEGGGVLINQAIHFLDAIQWIMGGVESISAVYENFAHRGAIEVEDTITAAVRYRRGALGTIEATSGSNLNWEYVLAIHGTEGAVELRNDKPVKVAFKDEATQQRVRDVLESGEADEAGEAAGAGALVEGAKAYYGSGHTAQIADAVDAVREGRLPFVTGEDAAETTRLVLTAYESARRRAWLDISDAARVSASPAACI
ncbi:MAG: Gfo/Idh/MocA family protein [Phycisphaeraceae bacterium]